MIFIGIGGGTTVWLQNWKYWPTPLQGVIDSHSFLVGA